MGTVDYCILTVLLLSGLVALSIKHEEQRMADRRQRTAPPPGGLERRSGKDRRRDSLAAYVLWAARAQWFRFRKRH